MMQFLWWHWIVLGIVVVLLELAVPAFFLVWFGLGALIVGVFQSGLRLAGVDVLWQVFAIGWLIIIAVAMDQWIRKVSA